MQSISEILKQLSDTDRAVLMVAFEQQSTHYFEYVSKRFIGVNTDNVPHLECEQVSGDFREGIIHHSV